jgi:hypothetical protein
MKLIFRGAIIISVILAGLGLAGFDFVTNDPTVSDSNVVAFVDSVVNISDDEINSRRYSQEDIDNLAEAIVSTREDVEIKAGVITSVDSDEQKTIRVSSPNHIEYSFEQEQKIIDAKVLLPIETTSISLLDDVIIASDMSDGYMVTRLQPSFSTGVFETVSLLKIS